MLMVIHGSRGKKLWLLLGLVDIASSSGSMGTTRRERNLGVSITWAAHAYPAKDELFQHVSAIGFV
jgi:hypothetical protein